MKVYSVVVWLVCVGTIRTIYSRSTRRLCDIRIWYLNLVINNIFDIKLDDKQADLKNSIEALVVNLSDNPDARLKDCHVVEMYNDMLKETFHFDSLTAKNMREYVVKEIETVMSEGGGIKDDLTGDSATEKDHISGKPGEIGTKENDNPETISLESDEDIPDDSEENSELDKAVEDTPNDSDENTELDNKNDSDDVETVSNEDTEKGSHDETEDNTSDKDSNTPSYDELIDETDLFEDLSEFEDYEEVDDEHFEVSNDNQTDDSEFETHEISFGVCWSFGCLPWEIFDLNHTKVSTSTQIERVRAQLVDISCIEKKACHKVCYYFLLTKQCIMIYETSDISDNSSSNVHQETPKRGTLEDDKTQENDNEESILVNDNRKGKPPAHLECENGSNNCHRDVNNGLQTDNDFDERNEKAIEQNNFPKYQGGSGNKRLDKTDSDTKTERQNKINSKDNTNSVTDIDKEKFSKTAKDAEFLPSQMEAEISLKHDNGYGDADFINRGEGNNNRNRPSSSSATGKDRKDQMDIDELEKLIQVKTGDYAHKIQTLELMIVNLEKQLLLEQLNKQNHTSTYTRLENLVLKLENDLLKMNRFYQNLKDETETIHRKQNKQLELTHEGQNDLQFPDHGKEAFELVAQQQNKINELSEILQNQSDIIQTLKHRHDMLEEQNRMLHQMVMNQTIFMTSIIQTVQDLSKQNAKNEKEMSEMKLMLQNALKENDLQEQKEENTPFNNMIQTLDAYTSDTNAHMQLTKDKKTSQNLPDNRQLEEFVIIWCPLKRDTCPYCFYNSVFIPNCLPYRKLIWFKCKNSCKIANNFLPLNPSGDDNSKISEESEHEINISNEEHNINDISNLDMAIITPNTKTEEPAGEKSEAVNAVEETLEQKPDSNSDVLEQKSGYDASKEDSVGQEVEVVQPIVQANANEYVVDNTVESTTDKSIEVADSSDDKPVHEQGVPTQIDPKHVHQNTPENDDIPVPKADIRDTSITPTFKADVEHSYDTPAPKTSVKDTLDASPPKADLKDCSDTLTPISDMEDTPNAAAPKSDVNEITDTQKSKADVKETNDIPTPKADVKDNSEAHASKANVIDTTDIPKPVVKVKDTQAGTKDTLDASKPKADVKDSSDTPSPIVDIKDTHDSTTPKAGVKDMLDTSKPDVKDSSDKPTSVVDVKDTGDDPTPKAGIKDTLDASKLKADVKDSSDKPALKVEVKDTHNDPLPKADVKGPSDSNDKTTSTKAKGSTKTNAQSSTKKDKKTKSNQIDNTTSVKQRKVPINIGRDTQKEPKDCYEIYMRGSKGDGIYKIRPLGNPRNLEVFCDMKKGGWTVIQRRQDGSTNFFRNWDDYKKGFGGKYGEHWIGNDVLHLLTNQDYYKLRVDLIDWDKNKKYAEFGYFLVESENEGYRLHIEEYSGDAGDGLTKHNGHKFSTKDVDNDKVVKEFGGSCAKRFHGAGWYYKCYASNLFGKYYKGGKIPEKMFDGITWKPWTGPNYSMKKVVMKIRPKSADDRT